jgi:hypothetical protein
MAIETDVAKALADNWPLVLGAAGAWRWLEREKRERHEAERAAREEQREAIGEVVREALANHTREEERKFSEIREALTRGIAGITALLEQHNHRIQALEQKGRR